MRHSSGYRTASAKQASSFARMLFALIMVLSLVGVQPALQVGAQEGSTTFAVITDYGNCSTGQQDVANLVNGWEDVDFIVTAGDNHHGSTSSCTMGNYSQSVGGYYGDWVQAEAFWPVLGNHDFDTSGSVQNETAYFDYFTYLDGAYYYDFVQGSVHFFMLNSGGIGGTVPDEAAQRAFLQAGLAASQAPWKIVVLHIAPYTGGLHNYDTKTRWPYAEWGADFVISGHNHIYERIHRQEGPGNDKDIVYFTAGLGGGSLRGGSAIEGLAAYYYNAYGAMRVSATETDITFEYVTTDGIQRDEATYEREDPTDPIIRTSVSSLTPFTTQPDEPSAAQSYTVSGTNLTGDVVITPPAGFEISTSSGSGFGATTITLSPAEGTLDTTTIYVRMKRETPGSVAGTIAHASPDATTRQVAVSGTASLTSSDWVAYNDVVWASGQPSTNITTFTIPSDGTSSGVLVDYATGEPTPVSVAITTGGSPNFEDSSQYGGAESNADTDAYDTFHGIADMAGVIRYGSSGWYVDLAFSGLEPGGSYTFATTANRADASYTRNSRFTISGVDAAINASTSGVTAISNESVYFNTGNNTANGYVARWTGIDPGVDGAFTVRVEANSGTEAYGPSVFMLASEVPSDLPRITTSGALTPFSTLPGVPSGAQTYTVSGANLNEAITVSAPAGFEISTGGGTYASSLSLSPTGGTVGATTISVRLTGQEGAWSGNITHMSDGAVTRNVAVSGVVALTPPWTAYNDMAGTSTPANTTEFTLDASGGMLLDFDTGDDTGVTVNVTSDGSPFIYTDGGQMPDSGTDAYEVFNGMVNLGGVIMSATSNPTDYWVDVTLNNLDPNKTYTLVATANRAGGTGGDPAYTSRFTRYTISGMEAATNASSTGVQVYDDHGHSVYFCTGENTEAGYVARWVNIRPGADGSITVRAQPQDPSAPRTYAFGAFMVQEEATAVPNHAPTDIGLSHSMVVEGQPSGTPVGVLTSVDPDAGDTHTYSLAVGEGDDDNGSFAISGDQLLTAAIFDYDAQNSYTVRIRTTDQGGLSFEKTFTIFVTESGSVPVLPSSFYGEVRFRDEDGGPVEGNTLEAYLDDESDPMRSTPIFYDSGVDALVYVINVPAYSDGTHPDSVTFKFGERTVAIAPWVSGTNVALDLHPPKADAGGPYVAPLSAGSVTLAGGASDWGDDVEAFAWDFDNDGVYDDATTAAPAFGFTAAGTYPVALRVVDAQGGEGHAASDVVAVALGGLTGQVYDGSAKSVTVTGVASPYTYQVLYDGSLTAPVDVGSYAVVVEVLAGDHVIGTVEGEMTISALVHRIDLVAGWNLVSFNLKPADTSVAEVLASIAGSYDLVYAWDATGGHSGAGNWMRHDPAMEFGNSLEDLDDTQGFWIHMTEAAVLEVYGSFQPATDIELDDSAGGWNLIGYPSSSAGDLPEALSDIAGDYTLVYAYHAGEAVDPWKLYDADGPVYANDLGAMAPGWGYWIYVTSEATLPVHY